MSNIEYPANFPSLALGTKNMFSILIHVKLFDLKKERFCNTVQ